MDSMGSGARGSDHVTRPNLARSDPHMGSIPGEERFRMVLSLWFRPAENPNELEARCISSTVPKV